MSKVIAEIAIGAGIVALDLFAPGLGFAITPHLGELLLGFGSSLVLGGLGTLLNKNATTGLTTTVRNPIQPWNVIYGRARTSGTMVFIETTGVSDTYLHIVIVLACHPCQSVDALLFDGQPVSLDGGGNSFSPAQSSSGISSISRTNNLVTVHIGSPLGNSFSPGLAFVDGTVMKVSGVGDGSFNGTFPMSQVNSTTYTYVADGPNGGSGGGSVTTMYGDYGSTVHMEVMTGNGNFAFSGLTGGGDTGSQGLWSTDHRLSGRTAVYLRLAYTGNTYVSGIPNISFIVHGKNDIFDPRTGGHGYTENAALCIADYLTNQTFGFKAAYGTEIPNDALASAANICDESVGLSAGGSEPRYACNGNFSLSAKRGEILQNLLTSCGGRLTYSSGQYVIHPATYVAPTVTVADMNQFAGPFQWKAAVSVRDLFNGVKGTYVSPAQGWQISDFPPYCQDSHHGYGSDALLAQDNNERRWLEIQLPFTISAAAAQRLAKIELMRRRYMGSGTFAFNMALYQVTALDVLAFTLPVLQWSAKPLEITAHRFKLTKQPETGMETVLLGCEIDVKETDPAIYAWSTSEELAAQGLAY
jgi:hypothetical protein